MNPRRPDDNAPPKMRHAANADIWRAVEGAVVDAMKCHPDYLTDKGVQHMVGSVTKRVVGAVIAAQNLRRKRQGAD